MNAKISLPFPCPMRTDIAQVSLLSEHSFQWQKEIFKRDEKANIVFFTLSARE